MGLTVWVFSSSSASLLFSYLRFTNVVSRSGAKQKTDPNFAILRFTKPHRINILIIHFLLLMNKLDLVVYETQRKILSRPNFHLILRTITRHLQNGPWRCKTQERMVNIQILEMLIHWNEILLFPPYETFLIINSNILSLGYVHNYLIRIDCYKTIPHIRYQGNNDDYSNNISKKINLHNKISWWLGSYYILNFYGIVQYRFVGGRFVNGIIAIIKLPHFSIFLIFCESQWVFHCSYISIPFNAEAHGTNFPRG